MSVLVNGEDLIVRLQLAGFTVAGVGPGSCRLDWPKGRPGSLLVPRDPSAPEYDEMMKAALAELAAAVRVGQAIWREVAFAAGLTDIEQLRIRP